MRKLMFTVAVVLLLSGCSNAKVTGPGFPADPPQMESIAKSELTGKEVFWLEELQTLKANDEIRNGSSDMGGDYGVADELAVSHSNMGKEFAVEALVEGGAGVGYDSKTDQDYVVREAKPSVRMQGYFDVLTPAMESWHEQYGYWPSIRHTPAVADSWLLEPSRFDKYEAKPVNLRLPDTFLSTGYGMGKDSSTYTFEDRVSGEKATLITVGDSINRVVGYERFAVE